MTLAELLTVLIAFGGLGLGVRSYFRDRKRDDETTTVEKERHAFERRMTEEAVTIQRQLVEIEADRHRREIDALGAAEAEREEAERREQTANLAIRFAFRDSNRTWARILATNHGPAAANDVKLDVYGERGGTRVEINEIAGEDYQTADRLQPNESVHVATVFTMGSPQPADLRYRLSWTDGRGPQENSGQVPIA